MDFDTLWIVAVGNSSARSHPAGFSISGAPVGTFLRSAPHRRAEGAGQKVWRIRLLERVEKDLAFGASCARIFTTAIRRVYIAVFSAHLRAIRYFDCRELFVALQRIVRQRQWRFAKSTDPRIVRWALGDPVEE